MPALSLDKSKAALLVEAHTFLIEKLLPFQATIANAQDFLRALAGA